VERRLCERNPRVAIVIIIQARAAGDSIEPRLERRLCERNPRVAIVIMIQARAAGASELRSMLVDV